MEPSTTFSEKGTCEYNQTGHGLQRHVQTPYCDNWAAAPVPQAEGMSTSNSFTYHESSENDMPTEKCPHCNGYHLGGCHRAPTGAAPAETARPDTEHAASSEELAERFPKLFKPAEPEAVETAEQLAVNICRELYDRFVMGGWQPEEAHDYIRDILKAHAKQRVEQAERRVKVLEQEIEQDGQMFADGKALILKLMAKVADLERERDTLAGERCQNCHRENPVWFAPNDVWNAVVTEVSGILCPICFINRAERQGFKCTGWELAPENIPGQLGPKDAIIDALGTRVDELVDSMYAQKSAAESELREMREALERQLRWHRFYHPPCVEGCACDICGYERLLARKAGSSD